MAKIKPERAFSREVFSGFGGMGTQGSLTGKWAADMRNFRIRGDGSLEKRKGWRLKREFTDSIRAVWQGTVGGASLCFAVCSTVIFRVTDSSATVVGRVADATGRLSFFQLNDTLYLTNRGGLLVWDPDANTFSMAEAYVPLYGHNWHPSSYGDVNEPINLLTRRLRIHYLNTTGSTSFSLPFFAESVDQVRVNNVEVTDYTLDAAGDTVHIPSAANASVVELAYTMEFSSALADQLAACTNSFVDRRDGQETLFLYGAPQGYRLFPSHPVSIHMWNACRVFYPQALPLYMREEDLVNVGNAVNPARALCPHYDRVLAFCREGVWSVAYDKEQACFDAVPVLNGFGCGGTDAVIPYEQDVLVCNRGGLYRLHATSGSPDAFHLTRLSAPIDETLRSQITEDICLWYHESKNEIWLRPIGESTGCVWILQMDSDRWYCFDHIAADFFMTLDGVSGFAAGTRLCLLDGTLTTDNGEPFAAYYQSGYLTFDRPETVKRALRASLCANTGGNTLHLTLESEQSARSFALEGEAGDAPELFDLRIGMGRFRFLRFRVSVTGDQISRIHGISFYSQL